MAVRSVMTAYQDLEITFGVIYSVLQLLQFYRNELCMCETVDDSLLQKQETLFVVKLQRDDRRHTS